MRSRLVGDTFGVVEVLDRVLDKGVVVEKGWVLLSLDLVHLEARVVISSLSPYLAEPGGPTHAKRRS